MILQHTFPEYFFLWAKQLPHLMVSVLIYLFFGFENEYIEIPDFPWLKVNIVEVSN